MKITVKKDTTQKIVNLFITDGFGNGKTGLAYNTASFVCHYMRETDDVSTEITLADGTLGTWGSGDFKEVDATDLPGVYQFGIPNAVLATGEESAKIVFTGAASTDDFNLDIHLTGFDYSNGRVALSSAGLDQITVETGINARQALSIIGSVLAGENLGADTSNIIFKAMDDNSTTRLSVTIDSSDNRTTIVLTPPA
ncbi:MAG: hypothetical protein DRH26_01780 [Deltaproteobacteria bacterium]|nr:MAG: hypothetical protein DRH26_01780 [Deltaproteobacteria bacterium]